MNGWTAGKGTMAPISTSYPLGMTMGSEHERPSVLTDARELLERGFNPIQLRPRTKKPDHEEWQKSEPTRERIEADFADGSCNIGLVLGERGGGLVDVDLDHPLAISLAPKFLPNTGMRHGRPGAPSSHYQYIPHPTPRAQDFSDPTITDPSERAMLVQLLATGKQVMVPRSMHPDGELLHWESFELPARVDGRELERQVRWLAAATLFARHWVRGARHQMALALAGALMRSGWAKAEVMHFVLAIAEAAGDEEAVERLRDVATTGERLADDEPATGAPTLAHLMPEAVVRKAFKWLGITWSREKAKTKSSQATPVMIHACDIEPEPVEWLSKGRIPYGKITVLDGDPEVGKSTLTIDIAARITTGRSLFTEDSQQDPSREPADVVFVCCEDGVRDTIRTRLEAAGADLRRVHIIEEVEEPDGSRRLPRLPDDIPAIRQALIEHGAKLLVIDPLSAYIGGRTDNNNDPSLRRVLSPVAQLADQTGAAILVVRHLKKGSSDKAIYAGQGNIALIAQARCGLLVGLERGEGGVRVLAVSKCNLAPKGAALRFRIEEVTGEHDGRTWACGRVRWMGETEVSADDLVDVSSEASSPTAIAEAEDFLREALADGPLAANEIKAEASDRGISYATLRRAQKKLGVVSKPREWFQRHGMDVEGQGRWCWALPDPEPRDEG
jgi:hypothetical protein